MTIYGVWPLTTSSISLGLYILLDSVSHTLECFDQSALHSVLPVYDETDPLAVEWTEKEQGTLETYKSEDEQEKA